MLLETNYYPDANTLSTLQAGAEFVDFVTIVMKYKGLYLQPLMSKKAQFQIGESIQGWEVKLDRRFTETGHLHIEIAEKTRLSRDWVPSGIYRDDNTWLYIQGNFEYFFIFPRKFLTMLHGTGRYKEYAPTATIRVFQLPLADAERYGEKVIPDDDDALVTVMRAQAARAEYRLERGVPHVS